MKKNRGFIALISVLIISFVLFFAVVSVSQRGILGRFQLLDLERKSESEKLAEACTQVAIIAIINDSGYAVYPTKWAIVSVGTGNCAIYSVTQLSGQSLIKTTASSTGATTNLEVVINNTTGSVISWQEVGNF